MRWRESERERESERSRERDGGKIARERYREIDRELSLIHI